VPDIPGILNQEQNECMGEYFYQEKDEHYVVPIVNVSFSLQHVRPAYFSLPTMRTCSSNTYSYDDNDG